MSKLFLVSTGPGDPALLTPMAREAIEASTDLVAYGLYMDLLKGLCAGKTRHDLPLGEEINRAKLALDLASSGKNTALLSSGDIGIFAMATLVFELLDGEITQAKTGQSNTHSPWLGIDIEVIPGVSAMQASASSVGALLGHDFCAISLSDLLTPWQTIEKRIHCAGEGDFVISFYNPVSKKRNWQLNTARDILLTYRPENTPVVLGRNLTREDQSIAHTTLKKLDAADVDMFTCVSIGNSESRHIINPKTNNQWIYTPRGYSKKL